MRRDTHLIIRRILKDIQVELKDEFDKNFERQGFFSEKWQRRKSPTRPGGAILVDTGSLRRSVRSKVTDNSVAFYTDLPYAGIHNEGGEIVVTARMKRYFRAKFYESQGGFKRKEGNSARKPLSDGGFYAWTSTMPLSDEAEFWRFMALKKVGTKIKIPRRKFLGAGPEVEKAVREIIEENLNEFFSQFTIHNS